LLQRSNIYPFLLKADLGKDWVSAQIEKLKDVLLLTLGSQIGGSIYVDNASGQVICAFRSQKNNGTRYFIW
jgi:hypothetical protein